MDLTLAGALEEYVGESGECGISEVVGTGGGGGIAMLGTALELFVLDSFFSAAFRVAERRPDGKEETGLAASGALAEVEGLLPSSEGRGRGPSLTLGFVYCA
jgi:hypothetical protein